MRSALAVLLAATLCSQCTTSKAPAGATDSGRTATLSLAVEDELTGSGLSLSRDGTFEKGTNALDAVKELVELRQDRKGMVDSICGVTPDSTVYYWTLYVDGEYSQIGLGGITLEQDTAIEWRITKLPDWAAEPSH